MIRTALGGLYIETVRDGFSYGLWPDAHLDPLQQRLQDIDIVSAVLNSMREGEMAGICHILERFTNSGNESRRELLQMFSLGNSFLEGALVFLPSGWVRRNQLLCAQLLKEWIDTFSADGKRYYPKRAADTLAHATEEFAHARPGNVLAANLIPNFQKAGVTTARNQSRFAHAILVCALERYRNRTGEYPPSLPALEPEFVTKIPIDIITGEPPVYRRTATNHFVLYGIGEDAKDDGGDSVKDWVWDTARN
jgi:hypothetical protein